MAKTKIVEIIVDGEKTLAKKCRKCEKVRPLYEYYKSKSGIGGVNARCKLCTGAKEIPVTIEINGERVRARVCETCKVKKPLTDFHKTKNQKISNNHCKECKKKLWKEYHVQKNREVLIINGIKEDAKKCRVCGVIKPLREYGSGKCADGLRSECKVCRNNYMKKYFKENPEKARENLKKQYRKNPQKFYTYQKRWALNNPEKASQMWKVSYQRREARKKELPNTLTTKQWKSTLKYFNNFCALTGKKEELHMDHFIPLGVGCVGTIHGNMIPLSSELNISKHANNPFEWFYENKDRFGLSEDKFVKTVSYLAELNNMSFEEYKDYVYQCFGEKAEEY